MNGRRLKDRRKLFGMTAEVLAEKLNTTRVTVSRWESGASEPNDKTKLALAEILETSVSYLMGETDDSLRYTPLFTPEELKEAEESAATHSHIAQDDAIAKMTTLLRFAVKNKDQMTNGDKQLLKSLLQYGIDELE